MRVERSDNSEQVVAVIFKLPKGSHVGEGLHGLWVMPKIRTKTSVRCIERPEKGLCSGSKWMSDCETMAIVQVWNKVLLSLKISQVPP